MDHRALFLARGCVISRDPGENFYVEQVRAADGVFSLCRTALKLGFRLVMVTHEKDLANGAVSAADYNTLTRWMQQEFLREEIVFEGVYHCPSKQRLGFVESDPDPWDGNVGVGTLRRAARDLHLALFESLMVTSRSIDVAAANAGGLSQAFLLCGPGRAACGGVYTEVRSLGEIEAWLVAHPEGTDHPSASQRLALA
jgi:D-glycero-D-manno-heptose 1,7-bisphosphate phosphatase